MSLKDVKGYWNILRSRHFWEVVRSELFWREAAKELRKFPREFCNEVFSIMFWKRYWKILIVPLMALALLACLIVFDL